MDILELIKSVTPSCYSLWREQAGMETVVWINSRPPHKTNRVTALWS